MKWERNKQSACILISLCILIINLNPKPNCFIDSLTVNDLKGFLKSVLKEKSKETNRDDLIIDWTNISTQPTCHSTRSRYGVAGPSSSKSKASRKSVQSSPSRSSKSSSSSSRSSESNSPSRSESSPSPSHSPPAVSGSIYICYETWIRNYVMH